MSRGEIAVLGGGAAGLAAAVMLARQGFSVTVYERAPRVGRKLLATGNGTCNITNIHAAPSRYHGEDPAFVAPALAAFGPARAMAFFASLGVVCVPRPDGRVYPLCAQASAVLDCLRAECAALGVTERCDTPVTAIRPGFTLVTPAGERRADRVAVATGGAASPSLGGTAEGYGLLTALGHRKTPLFASVTQICASSPLLRAVKGIRVEGTVTLLLNGRAVARETGEILFAEYGLSGPAALAVSRWAGDWERQKKGTLVARVDLLPECSEQQVEAELIRRRRLPGRTLEELLTGYLNKRVGQTALKATEILPLSRPAASLTEGEAAALAKTIKGWDFTVTGTKGLGSAQVTAGGIATAGFDPVTMQSRLVPGLYALGEVLDVDGDCGGFNLQWAWSSAAAAARHIGEEMP